VLQRRDPATIPGTALAQSAIEALFTDDAARQNN
jgi:hypothetical protein